MNKKPILVFDLDGTLVSTEEDLVDSLNYSLKKQNISQIESDSLSQYIGFGGQVMIEKALKKEGIKINQQLVDTMLKDFLDYYAHNIPGKSHYFNGVIETLKAFSKKGYIFAICTNKAEHTARKLIKSLNQKENIECPFSALAGGDTYEWRKPDPRHIYSVIKEANGSLDEAVMIGDSAPDIMAAHAAKIPSIVASFGYSDVPVEELKADRIINSYDDLTPELVENLITENQYSNTN